MRRILGAEHRTINTIKAVKSPFYKPQNQLEQAKIDYELLVNEI
jgi:hypothetical protein